MKKLHTLPAVLVACTALLAGCGGTASDTDSGAAASPTAGSTPTAGGTTGAPADAGTTIDITIAGDSVTPSGDRVKAKIGEPVTLKVTSDRAGGLHVHSTPEQQLEFDKGTTTLTVTIDKPGIVDVEEHESGVVIVQLEVS